MRPGGTARSRLAAARRNGDTIDGLPPEVNVAIVEIHYNQRVTRIDQG